MATKMRSLSGLAVITCVMVSVLVSLGVWQLQRLDMKTELLRNIEVRISAPSIALPPETRWAHEDLDYLKVTVRGTFRHSDEAYLFGVIDKNNRGDNTPGFFVLTPLLLENGATLIVNRGFVPQDRKDPVTRIEGQVSGVVTVTGLLRLPERKTLFTPEPDPQKRVLYARDPALMAQWSGLARTAPFSLDADASQNPGGLPSGGHTIVSVPNNHLQYAITWLSLASVMLAMFGFYAFKWRKPGSE